MNFTHGAMLCLILAEAAKREEERWHNLLSESKSMGYKEQYCTLLNKVDYFLECCEHRSAKKRAIIFKVKLLWNMWKEHCKNGRSHRKRKKDHFIIHLTVVTLHLRGRNSFFILFPCVTQTPNDVISLLL